MSVGLDHNRGAVFVPTNDVLPLSTLLLLSLTLSSLTRNSVCVCIGERERALRLCVCMREHYDVSCTPACMYVSTARSFFTDRDREEFDTIKMTNLYYILFK